MVDKIFKKKCKLCNKVISSLSEQQCAYNFKAHKEACRRKIVRQENKLKKDDNEN